jgi:hypothetical protein
MWEIFIGLVGSLLFAILNYIVYVKNIAYSKIIKDFKKQLPPSNKRATKIEKSKSEELFGKDSFLLEFTGLDVSTHKSSISESEIDKFFNEINDFNYSFVIFSKYYKSITSNLNRFNKAVGENKNIDLVMIQEILNNTELNFWKILWYKKIALRGRYNHLFPKFRIRMWKITKNPKWLK